MRRLARRSTELKYEMPPLAAFAAVALPLVLATTHDLTRTVIEVLAGFGFWGVVTVFFSFSHRRRVRRAGVAPDAAIGESESQTAMRSLLLTGPMIPLLALATTASESPGYWPGFALATATWQVIERRWLRRYEEEHGPVWRWRKILTRRAPVFYRAPANPT